MKAKAKPNTYKMKECIVRLELMDFEDLIQNAKVVRAEDLSKLERKYNLRHRKEPVQKSDEKTLPKTKTNTTNVKKKETLDITRKSATLANANKMWLKLVSNAAEIGMPLIGEIVIAKMRSYKPWPARILNENGKTVYWVKFYGKGSHGSVKKVDCISFDKAIECILLFLKCSPNKFDDFNRSIREAEIDLGIPNERSLLNF